MLITVITDDEILYRRVPSGRKCYSYRPDGTIGIEPVAFEDRECRISVDRAQLRANNPLLTLNQEDDGNDGGVVSLITGDVRSIGGLSRNNQAGKSILDFTVDVEHVPLAENEAHSEIHGNPDFDQVDKKRAFRRLRHRLAELAEARGWEILPRVL